jgi:hypothetical protein
LIAIERAARGQGYKIDRIRVGNASEGRLIANVDSFARLGAEQDLALRTTAVRLPLFDQRRAWSALQTRLVAFIQPAFARRWWR